MKYIIFLCLLVTIEARANFDLLIKPAIDSGNLEAIKQVSSIDLDSRERGPFGVNALSYSLVTKKYEISKYLIEMEIGINTIDFYRRTPLIVALSSNSPVEIVQLLLDKKSNIRLKDKLNRDAMYYASKHSDKSLLALLSKKLENYPPLTDEKIVQLKDILKNGTVESLTQFFNVNRTLEFNSNAETLENFLVSNSLIPRFGFEVLVSFGLNIFDSTIINSIFKNSSELDIEKLMHYRINVDQKDNINPLVSIVNSINSDDLVIKVLNRAENLKVTDNEGNSLLVLAIKKKRSKVINYLLEKGLDLNTVNSNGESGFLLLADYDDSKMVSDIFKKYKVDDQVVNANGDNAYFLLYQNNKDVFNEIVDKIPSDILVKRNSKGKALVDYLQNDSVAESIKKLAKEVTDQVPNFNRVDTEFDFQNNNPEIILKDLNKESKINEVFSGDREFDQLVTGAIENYLLGIRNNVIASLASDNSPASSVNVLKKLERKKVELGVSLVHLDQAYTGLMEKKNRLEIKSNSDDVKSRLQKLSTYNGEIRKLYESIVFSLKEVEESLIELKNLSDDLKMKLKELEAGKSEVDKKIEQAKNDIKKTKLNNQNFNERLQKEVNELVTRLRVVENNIQIKIDELNRHISKNLTEIDHEKLSMIKNEESKNLNDALMRSPEHKDEHIHDASKCKFLAAIEYAHKNIKNSQNKITSLLEENKNLEIKRSRFTADLLSVKADNEKEVKLLQEDNKKKKISADKAEKETVARLEDEINSLKNVRHRELKNITLETKLRLDQIKAEYGDVDNLVSQYQYVLDSLLVNNSLDAMSSLYVCSALPIMLCNVNPQIVGRLSSSYFGEKILNTLDSGSSFILGYFLDKTFLSDVSTISSDVESLMSEIVKHKEKRDALKSQLIDLDSDIQKAKLEVANSDDESQISNVLPLVLDLEQLRFLQLLSDNIAKAEETLKQINQIKVNGELSKNTNFSSFEEKLPVKSNRVFKFNKLYITDISKLSLELLKPEDSYKALKDWHSLLIKNASYQQSNTENLSSSELFSRSLLKNVSVSVAKFNGMETLYVRSGDRVFLVDDLGSIIDAKVNDDEVFDFTLVSTGKVREKIEEIKAILKNNMDGYSKEELKSDYDFFLITNIIKKADLINSLDTSMRMLSAAKMLAAYFIPGGTAIAGALGIAECGANLYKAKVLGVKQNHIKKIELIVECISTLGANFLENIKLSKVFTDLVSNFVSKYSLNSNLVARTKSVSEVFFDDVLSSGDIEYFLQNALHKNEKLNFFYFLIENSLKNKQTKIINGIYVDAIEAEISNDKIFNGIHVEGLTFLNVCEETLSPSQFLIKIRKLVKSEIGLNKITMIKLMKKKVLYLNDCVGFY